jgi:hypothetical protein
MGIDILDMTFRVEKCFAVKLSADDYERVSRGRMPPDISVGEVLDMIRAKGGRVRTCPECSCNVRDCRQPKICPECRSLIGDWDSVRIIIGQVVAIDPDQVARETLLVRDLGMS